MVKAWCHLLQFPKVLVPNEDIEEHRALQTALLFEEVCKSTHLSKCYIRVSRVVH